MIFLSYLNKFKKKMNKSVFLRFLCALCVIYGINADDDTAPFCEPYKPDVSLINLGGFLFVSYF